MPSPLPRQDRWTCSLMLSIGGGLPRAKGGSAPALPVSRPAWRSLALRPACSPSRHCDPLHRRLQRLRYLHRCFDCYRAERTSSRAGLPPAVDQRLFTAHLRIRVNYLEKQVPTEGFVFGDVSIADISVACFFRNAAFAGFRADSERWPRTAAFVERVLKLDSFERLKPIEDCLRRTPLARHRATLTQLGVPVTRGTYGTAEPRRGVMRID